MGRRIKQLAPNHAFSYQVLRTRTRHTQPLFCNTIVAQSLYCLLADCYVTPPIYRAHASMHMITQCTSRLLVHTVPHLTAIDKHGRWHSHVVAHVHVRMLSIAQLLLVRYSQAASYIQAHPTHHSFSSRPHSNPRSFQELPNVQHACNSASNDKWHLTEIPRV